MAPKQPRLRILAVGGNPVSAFLSWRLQATNACDITVVWKNGFEHVSQYGLSFKSLTFGNERFKPRRVVRSCEEAAQNRDGPFDYVVVCVKALPDVYDLTSIVESVVTPQHTCIVVNTTNNLGVEAPLEERFPTNVVLSLVSGADLSQLGPSEFEHQGSAEVWIGPPAQNGSKPSLVREDMAQALAMTLSTGQIQCNVSRNIRQQQFERVMGPVTFQPISVLFETPNHAQLLEKVGVKELVSDVLDELLGLADKCGCTFDADSKTKIIEENTKPNTPETPMWQDFVARRPMEIEVFLGSPIKLAKDLGVSIPRIETLYTILHHVNTSNRSRPKMLEPNIPKPPGSPSHMPRASSQSGHRPTLSGMPMPPPNGMGPPRQPRPRNSSNFSQAGGMRRGPPPGMNGGPPMNGYRGPPPPHMNGGSRAPSRRGSMDANDLEEFSHLVLYDDIPEGSESAYGGDSDISMREREVQIRQRELALKEQEMRMRRGPPSSYGGPRRGPHPMRNSQQVFDDEDDDDYFDPNMAPSGPPIDPDNFDMMSVTSRKHRKAPGPSAGQMRRHPDMDGPPSARGGRFRPNLGRNRSSQMGALPNVNDNIMDDPLMSCSSNRYGTVDRGHMAAGSRTNSLTNARLEEMQHGGPPGMNGVYGRRASQSPGNPYGPSTRGGNGRPSPPNGYGPPMNGRPSPPDGMRQPMARYPHDQGNGVPPHHVEQQVGVSSLHPPKSRNNRSLTGSASASAGSGELDSEPSAHSSQSSFQQRPPVGVN